MTLHLCTKISANSESFKSPDTDIETDISADTNTDTDNFLSLVSIQIKQFYFKKLKKPFQFISQLWVAIVFD
jgi:hypothetical protein